MSQRRAGESMHGAPIDHLWYTTQEIAKVQAQLHELDALEAMARTLQDHVEKLHPLNPFLGGQVAIAQRIVTMYWRHLQSTFEAEYPLLGKATP